MKILLTLHEYLDPNSGAAGSTLSLGEQYVKQGHQVIYYAYDDLPDRMSLRLKDLVFPEFTVIKILKTLKEQHIDVIDASTGDAWIWGSFLRPLTKKTPLLVTRSHGLDHMEHLERLEDAKLGNMKLSWKYPLYRGSIQLWEIATSLRCADAAFLLNHQDADYAVNHLGVKPERAYVFPNGIPDEFLNLPFAETPPSPSIIRIAQIGSYVQRKGIDYSVPALSRVLAKYDNVRVSLLGTEPPTVGGGEALKVQADFDPAVRDRVTVIPYFVHKTLPDLLKDHQINLFPTLSEGFGKTLIEAMACGLAPITTPAPGPMDIVQDGHDAIVVPLRDTQAIEQALERLITDRAYLDQLRRNAYATAQKYSWQRIAQERLTVYEKELAKRGQR
jgi:glycosyltransferase involved in cell wall biosynthesis